MPFPMVQVGENLTVFGPDVLTSCGQYGRVLELSKHVVGVGGPCNPISAWTEVEDYTERDLQQLNDLAESFAINPEMACTGCVMACTGCVMVSSLPLLLLLFTIAVLN